MKTLLPLTLAALLLGSTAYAQDQTAFDRLDSDGDDKLSFTDLNADYPDLTQEQFDAADVNTDDFLDLTEFGTIGSQASGDAQGTMAADNTTAAANADASGDAATDVMLNGRALTQTEVNIVTNHCETIAASAESSNTGSEASNDSGSASPDNSTDQNSTSNTVAGETGAAGAVVGIDLDTVNLAVCQELNLVD